MGAVDTGETDYHFISCNRTWRELMYRGGPLFIGEAFFFPARLSYSTLLYLFALRFTLYLQPRRITMMRRPV